MEEGVGALELLGEVVYLPGFGGTNRLLGGGLELDLEAARHVPGSADWGRGEARLDTSLLGDVGMKLIVD